MKLTKSFFNDIYVLISNALAPVARVYERYLPSKELLKANLLARMGTDRNKE